MEVLPTLVRPFSWKGSLRRRARGRTVIARLQNQKETTEFDQLLRKFETLSVEGSEQPTFARLLADFANLPPAQPRPKTLLDVTGFPHAESASSNLLAFLLNPQEEHGLGDLVLKSLLEAAQLTQLMGELSSKTKVSREDSTAKGKRIDIVVETKSFVLGIENKILARVDNPLEEYWQYLQARANETGKAVYCILLSLHGHDATQKLCGFRPVIYETLFSVLRKNIGANLFNATPKHLFYLLDFITTLENLKIGTHMDSHLLKFFTEQEDVAYRFYEKTLELIEELKLKSRPLKDVKLPNDKLRLKSDAAMDSFAWYTWCEIDLGGGVKFGMQVGLELNGWKISSYSFYEKNCKLGKSRIEELLKGDIISLGKWRKEDEADLWEYASFAYEEGVDTVRDKFQELLNLVGKHLVSEP